jgi:hypothetical protein
MENLMIKQLVGDLSRDLVTQVAPQELPLFRANSEVFFRNPDELAVNRKAKDDMLGFGDGGIIVLITPVVLMVTQQVVLFVIEQVKKSAQEQGSALIDESVKKMFKKFRPVDGKKPNPLTAEQLAQVRKVALKKAQELKLSDERARLLADALVGSLAIV